MSWPCRFEENRAEILSGLAAGISISEMSRALGLGKETLRNYRRILARGDTPGKWRRSGTPGKMGPQRTHNPFIAPLRQRRVDLNMSCAVLGKKIGDVSREQVARWERGDSVPTHANWIAWVQALGGDIQVKFPPVGDPQGEHHV